MDTLTTQENLVKNIGEGLAPSPPPLSSSKVGSEAVSVSKTDQPGRAVSTAQTAAEAAQLELSPGVEGALTESQAAEKLAEEQTTQQLQETIDRLNDKLSKLDREIELRVDERINKNYVSVVDKQSKEVIREFPPKEIRSFIARFMEFNERLASITDLRSLILNLEV